MSTWYRPKAMTMAMGNGANTVVANDPSQHAFIMLGEKALFLAHMTMFHMEEHMFQMVLRASLQQGAMDAYIEDRHAHPTDPYFLGNVIHELFTVPSVACGRVRAFTADIWRGIPYKKHYEEWPWDGVEPFLSNVSVLVERVVYFRHFDFRLGYPEALTYILFGEGGEAHMNHYQVKEPDFDQVVSLKGAPAWIPADNLAAGVDINFPTLPSKAYCENPIPPDTYTVQYAGQNNTTGPIEVGTSWWCSTKVVNMDDPCPEATANMTIPRPEAATS